MGRRKYTAAVAGLGKRGEVHVKALKGNADRFEIAAVCDLKPDRLELMANRYGIDRAYDSVDAMLTDVKPDVFVFVTQPDVRLEMIKLAVKHNIKAVAFEKPMATSVAEAAQITDLCVSGGIKTIVSHQQKYLTSMRRLKQIVDAGEIGDIVQMNISTQGWMAHLGTHYMDLALWVNGCSRAKWAAGHVHGRGKLTDNHPSADYIMGQVEFENGVRLFLENGYLSRSRMSADKFWFDNRLTVYGETGHVWAETNGAWGGCVRGETVGGIGGTWVEQEQQLQIDYFGEFAEWLDDDGKVHPSNISIAYHGYETLEALCLSALENRLVRLPVNAAEIPDILERMRAIL